VSHVDSQVISEVLGEFEKEYGKEAPLTVSHGKSTMRACLFNKRYSLNQMYDYIKNMLAELPPVMDGESRTPAPLHLFEVNEEDLKLSKKDAQFFHHYVVNLLLYARGQDPTYKQQLIF